MYILVGMKKHLGFILLLLAFFSIGCTVTAPDEEGLETTMSPTSQASATAQPSATVPATNTPSPVSPTPTVIAPTATATATEPAPPPEPEVANQSDGRSNLPAVSDDGQHIAFTSDGALAADALGQPDALYLRDQLMGETTLVNRTLEGATSRFPVYGLALSGDGRYVAYYSHEGDLVAGDELDCGIESDPISCEDLFIYDSQSQETIRIPLGRGQGLGKDYTLALSSDGRLVAYGVTVLDWSTGQSETIPTTDGQPVNGEFLAPQFTAGDRLLAFVSSSANLVPDDNNDTHDVFVWDRESGLVERVSVTSEGAEANDVSGALPFHEGTGSALAISADGRYVAFTSLATNLVSEEVAQCVDYRGFNRPCYTLYLHDRQTGQTWPITAGANGDSQDPTLSGDGRYLAFSSLATNLGAEKLPECEFPAVVSCGQIYLLDNETGQISLVSLNDQGQPGNRGSWQPQLSADGSSLVFVSEATNLVPDDSNEASDIFVFNLGSGLLERASLKSTP